MSYIPEKKDGLHIGIDARVLDGNMTGVGRYVSEICKCLDRLMPTATFVLFSNRPIKWEAPSARWIKKVDSRWSTVSPLVWLKFFSAKFIEKTPIDVFWGGAHFLPGIKVPCVLTVHDFVHIYAPETMPLKFLWGHKLFMSHDIKKAKSVICVSEGTQSRLKQVVGYLPYCEIASPAVSNLFQRVTQQEIQALKLKYSLGDKFLLMVATAEPRKNIEKTVKVFNELKQSGKMKDITLILVGSAGWKNKKIKECIDASEGVYAVGYVPDKELPAFYSAADGFLFFSSYEGFGMPVREALSCQTSVLAADIPEIREAGGQYASYFKPNEEGIKNALYMYMEKNINNIEIRPCYPGWENTASVYARHFEKAALRVNT